MPTIEGAVFHHPLIFCIEQTMEGELGDRLSKNSLNQSEPMH